MDNLLQMAGYYNKKSGTTVCTGEKGISSWKKHLDTPCTRLWPRLRKSRLRIHTRKRRVQAEGAD
jgi:hypothetical protein